MNKIDDPAAMPSYFANSRQTPKMKNDAVKEHMSAESFDQLALHNRAVISIKIILQSVSSQVSLKFERFNISSSDKNNSSIHMIANDPLAESESSAGIFDFEKVAKTIMEFVGGRILAAQAGGASEDELKEMFAQGRAGVNLGIDQALGDLTGLGMLDDPLRQGIEKSRDLLSKNLDDLYEKIFPTEKSSNSNIELQAPNARDVSLERELYASSSKSSDITITTTDGDIVSISFSDIQEYSSQERYQYQQGAKGISQNYSIANREYREMNFSYTVEGDLDDEEKAEIESLIKDVNSLQKDFFSGNVDQAFEKALELGFDNEQIASFSMDLQHSKSSYVSQTYTEVASFDEKQLPNGNKALKPLIDFLDDFRQLQETADKLLSKNDDAFGQLLDEVFKAEFGDNKAEKEKFDKVIDTVKTIQ